MAQEEQSQNEMIKIRREKLQNLVEAGKNPYEIDSYDVSHHSQEILDNFDELEETVTRVAGRIMSKRGHGKVSFIDLQDEKGRIQIFARENDLEEIYQDIQNLDLGDIIGVQGEVFKTKTGQISVRAKDVKLLTKSIAILPEKFHGLKDIDLRYRQRYVDLIVNPEVKEVFIARTKIIKAVREFLDQRGFLEVETPILSTVAGGANARPFLTHHNALDIDMQMRIANELYLKRLIVGGFDKIYEMGKMFRNEGISTRHNPEFTNMELYVAYANYEYIMELTEDLYKYIGQTVFDTLEIQYQGKTIDLNSPWRRVKMQDLVKEKTGVDFDKIETDQEALEIAKEKGLKVEEFWTRGHVIAEMFEEFCEADLIQPTFVIGHPVEVSPLAKRNVADPRITDRFELFINGWELANAFSELNDPIDQRKRFEAQVADKEAGDGEAHPMDEDFLKAIEVGLPPTGGLGVGIDRTIMLFTNQASIRDILFFPTMKPLDGQSDENQSLSADIDQANNLGEIDFSKVQVEPLFEDMIDFETFSKADFRAVKVLNCEEVPKSKKLLKFTLDDGSDQERTILSGIKQYYQAEDLIGKTLLAICNLPPRNMMGIDSEGMIISAIHEEEREEKLNLIILGSHIPPGAKMY